MSTYNEYLKKEKRKQKTIFLIKLTIIFTFLVTWELLVNFKLINSFLYSSPILIIKNIINLFENNSLLKHICVTLLELFLSFTITSIIGLAIASLMWFNKTLSNILKSFLIIINSLPKVALGPLFIIWIGANIKSIIFMSITISLFTTILNIYQSYITTNENYLLLLKTFKATKRDFLFKVVVPSNKSNIINSLKINMSLNFIGVIMGELLISKNGLGYLITYGSQVFNITLIMTSIFIIGILATIIDILINHFIKM